MLKLLSGFMNRKQTYTVLLIIATVIIYLVNNYVDKLNEDYPNSEEIIDKSNNEFDATFLPESTTGDIVEHNYYTLSYSEKHEQSEWIAYELKKEQLSNNDFKRPYFVQDRKVKTKSADWRNYKNSGYDRGHLCPAGDRTFNYDAFHETFLTSNISPQNHDFNRGIWNRLEKKVRYWSKKHDGVFVITGGVLVGDFNKIGEERVTVPNYFYKIIVNKKDNDVYTISFLIPNEPSNKSIYEYVVSIDEIESRTKIDFFPELEDKIENNIESINSKNRWDMH